MKCDICGLTYSGHIDAPCPHGEAHRRALVREKEASKDTDTEGPSEEEQRLEARRERWETALAPILHFWPEGCAIGIREVCEKLADFSETIVRHGESLSLANRTAHELRMQRTELDEHLADREARHLALERGASIRDSIIEAIAVEFMPDAMCFECGKHFGDVHDPECSVGKKLLSLELAENGGTVSRSLETPADEG